MKQTGCIFDNHDQTATCCIFKKTGMDDLVNATCTVHTQSQKEERQWIILLVRERGKKESSFRI